MNNDKTFAYLKQWRELQRRQQDLDFEKSRWARNVRSEYPRGSGGDEQFAHWCRTEIGLTQGMIEEMLLRATAAAIVPDQKTWTRVGGYASIKQLDELPRATQVSVLETVKSSGAKISTVLESRGLRSPTARMEPRKDAVELAAFIRSLQVDVPPNIKAVIERYEVLLAERRAA